MENSLIEINNENIKNLIYTIRGKQVMLDNDVEVLYQYKLWNLRLCEKSHFVKRYFQQLLNFAFVGYNIAVLDITKQIIQTLILESHFCLLCHPLHLKLQLFVLAIAPLIQMAQICCLKKL